MNPISKEGTFGVKTKSIYFINLLLYPGAWFRQINKYKVMMSKEVYTKIVDFMTLGAGVLVLERGHISHMVKTHYFIKNLLLYSQA